MYCSMRKNGNELICTRCGKSLPISGGKLPICEAQYPSILTQGANIAKSIFKYAVSGFQQVSESEFQARLKICQDCEFFDDTRCIKCGCFFQTKLSMGSEMCPINKWGPINSGNLE